MTRTVARAIATAALAAGVLAALPAPAMAARSFSSCKAMHRVYPHGVGKPSAYDFTYGTPTSLPWAHDFGDGVPRHPVQLYESAAMAAFAALYVRRVLVGDRFFITNGFYLAVGCYGLQRFAWEFLKPYGTLIGPFTLFHLLSAAVLLYAIVMVATAPKPESVHERAFA